MITDEQIWKYLDGTLDEAGRKEVAQEIASDKTTADLFQEISALHKSLKADTLLKPSASFTDKVMASVSMAPAAAAPVKLSIKPLQMFALPCIAVLAACVIYLANSNVQVSYSFPVHISMPVFSNMKMYFIIADIIILAFFLEALSDYRFNRKTFFS
jgi:anti-sigma factor RsiW